MGCDRVRRPAEGRGRGRRQRVPTHCCISSRNCEKVANWKIEFLLVDPDIFSLNTPTGYEGRH